MPENIPGFYVAHHPWFAHGRGSDALYKVGHTCDLRRRLHDDAYVTCFPPGFRYVHTVETESTEDAARLEALVLGAAASRRIGREGQGGLSELVALPLANIVELARALAVATGIRGTPRAAPVYPRPPRLPDSPARTPALSGPDALAAEAHRVPALPDLDDLLASLGEELEALTVGSSPAAVVGGGADEDEGAEDDDEDAEFACDLLLDDSLIADPLGDSPEEEALEDRPYQTDATNAALRELALNRKAILQMACRCGKTKVAQGVIVDYLGRRPEARVLYLVPGLALMRQTAKKLDRYGTGAALLLVGSDARALEGLRHLTGCFGGAPAGTTDPEAIRAAMEGTGGPLLVVSTYQSSPLLPDAFDLAVFDESHRVCGDRRPRPFTHVLLSHARGDRLFMTATPRYDAPVSMKDRALFGGIAYVYHMRSGIDAGYVNDFSLELVGRPADAAADDRDATPAQVMSAYETLREASPPGGATKLLVFCRNIAHAEELCAGTSDLVGAGVRCAVAHSRLPRSEVAAALALFCPKAASGILFNCRLFQEGVEIPWLNGAMFASPRHSPRDIIQSMCRSLNAMPGKPPSKVFIPLALSAPTSRGGVMPGDLGRFASVVPYFDALIAEDPLLYEHLLNPKSPYPMRWVGGSSMGRYVPRQVLAAARGYVRRGQGKTERLLRAARIPWEIGFSELERVVTSCGRYPKTTDCYVYAPGAKVNFSQFYNYARKAYVKWKAGEKQPLEPHQILDLQGLEGWEPYGVEGPYPWRETLDFLETWLRENGGTPPAVNINNGGYVGLEATPLERLSGTLTCVNQSDGRDRKIRGKDARRPGSGMTLSEDKQKDLDELCERWGLRWRKDRHPPPEGAAFGSLVEDEKGKYIGRPSFIQRAYEKFKAEYRANGAESEFIQKNWPDFPLKHRRMERADVWAKKDEIIPPRWRKHRKKKAVAAM